MDEVIDTIKIEVDGDSEKALGAIDRLIERLDKIQNAATGANKPLGALGRVMKKLDGIFSGSENMSKLRDLADGLSALGSVGKISISKTVADRIMDIGTAVDCLKDVDMTKLSDMASGLAALGNIGNIRMPNISAAANRAAGGGAPSAPSVFSGNGAAASVQTEATNSELTTTLTLVQKIKQGAAGTLGVVKQISDKIGSGIKKKLSGIVTMFTRRVVYRAMNALISLIVNGFRTGIAEVYQYSKAIDGRLAKSLDTIATAMGYLHASLGAAAAPIINMLAPAVDKLTDGFVNVLNIVNQVLARLSGADTWTRAIKTSREYAEATDDAAKANKKLKNSILGFDEINALNGVNASGAGSGTSGASYRFEEVPIDTDYVDDVIEKLKDVLTVVLAISAAVKGIDFAKMLSGLKFDKASMFVSGLTLTVAGLVIEFTGMADAIKNGVSGINLVEMLTGALGVTAGGIQIGKVFGSSFIGGGIGAIVGGAPMLVTGIYSSLKQGITWISASLTALGSSLVGAGIGAIIGACGGPLTAGLGALIGLAAGLIIDQTIYLFQNVGDIWDDFTEWMASLPEKVREFFSNLWQPIRDYDWYGLGERMGEKCGELLKSVKSVFTEWLPSVWEDLKEWFSELPQKIKETFDSAKQWFKDIGTAIIDGIIEGLNTVWDAITDFVSGFVQGFKNALGIHSPSTVFEEIGGYLWDGILNGLSAGAANIGSWVTDNIIDPISKKVKSGWETIKSWWSKRSLPEIDTPKVKAGTSASAMGISMAFRGGKYASGGFPDEGQLFIAREAGPEMVGTMGSRTAVANNAQIVEGIRQGVYEAMLASGRGEGDVVIQIVDADGTVRSERHISAAERRNRRDGRVVIPLGT